MLCSCIIVHSSNATLSPGKLNGYTPPRKVSDCCRASLPCSVSFQVLDCAERVERHASMNHGADKLPPMGGDEGLHNMLSLKVVRRPSSAYGNHTELGTPEFFITIESEVVGRVAGWGR